MIKLPSNRYGHTEIFSEDPDLIKPLLVQQAGESIDDFKARCDLELASHANKIRVARETGNWSELVVEGGKPTKFIFNPLSGQQVRRLSDLHYNAGKAEFSSMVFRSAIASIENFYDHKIEYVDHDQLGRIASTKTTDLLDSYSFQIVNELSAVVIERAYLRPKL